jgi:hypothetical protein
MTSPRRRRVTGLSRPAPFVRHDSCEVSGDSLTAFGVLQPLPGLTPRDPNIKHPRAVHARKLPMSGFQRNHGISFSLRAMSCPETTREREWKLPGANLVAGCRPFGNYRPRLASNHEGEARPGRPQEGLIREAMGTAAGWAKFRLSSPKRSKTIAPTVEAPLQSRSLESCNFLPLAVCLWAGRQVKSYGSAIGANLIFAAMRATR